MANQVNLTQDERDDIVELLVSNCGGCPSVDEDREVLNAVSDDLLLELATNAIPPQFQKANKAKQGAEDAPEEEEEEEMTEEAPATNSRLRTDDIVKLLPKEMQDSIRYAGEFRQKERSSLIGAIVANHNDDEKKVLTPIYEKMPLEELRIVANSRPKQAPESRPLPNYIGQATPTTNSRETADYNKDDYLPLPVINFQKNQKRA